ncbi:hypothetical protein BSN85_16360 [Bradyrhizobium brasilense]|nr:hypothetical protein BSN85_16360 [Bradyrhizobium brasilense]
MRRQEPESFRRDIAYLLSYAIIFNVGLVAAYYFLQSYGLEVWYAVKLVAVANICAIGSYFVGRMFLPTRYVGLTALAACALGIGGTYYFAEPPSQSRSRAVADAKLAEDIEYEAREERREPQRIPIRQALDAFFAKPFSPMFPNAAKGALCTAYPGFQCEETDPLNRPSVYGKDGAQTAELFLIEKGQGHLILSYRKEATGSFIETIKIVSQNPRYDYPTGVFPPQLLAVALGQLQRLGIDQQTINRCTGKSDGDRFNVKSGEVFCRREYSYMLRFSVKQTGPPLAAAN